MCVFVHDRKLSLCVNVSVNLHDGNWWLSVGNTVKFYFEKIGISECFLVFHYDFPNKFFDFGEKYFDYLRYFLYLNNLNFTRGGTLRTRFSRGCSKSIAEKQI